MIGDHHRHFVYPVSVSGHGTPLRTCARVISRVSLPSVVSSTSLVVDTYPVNRDTTSSVDGHPLVSIDGHPEHGLLVYETLAL